MGRLWLAAQTSDAIVTCISDGRGSARALAVEAARLDASVGDDTLARGSIKPRASALCRESS